jgi:hypothetical protein
MPDVTGINGGSGIVMPPGWTPKASPSAMPSMAPPPPSFQPSQNGFSPSSCGCSGKGCSCNNKSFSPNLSKAMNSSVQSWYDVPIQQAIDPRILIANAQLGTTQGTFFRSPNFGNAVAWVPSPFVLAGTVTCTSLHSDDLLTVADAAQWNFSHQGGNYLPAAVPPPVKKILFLRGGTEWEMSFDINLGGATYSDLQISFRDNAAVYGEFIGLPSGFGGIPTILFGSALTGTKTLKLTLKMTGTFVMAISARDGGGNASMFEMEWNIVP